MRLRVVRLAAGERLESLQCGGGVAALEETHPGEQIDVALPLRRERQHLEAARRGVEGLVGERVALGSGHVEDQAVRLAGEERPPVPHRRGRGAAGEAPTHHRRVGGRLLAGSIRARAAGVRGRGILSRQARASIFAALLRRARRGQGERAHLRLDARGRSGSALAGHLPRFRCGWERIPHTVHRVLHLEVGSARFLRRRRVRAGEKRQREQRGVLHCSCSGGPSTSLPPIEW